MRMLFLCFVVVLFISDNAANPVDSVDIVEASGEKENLTSNENTNSAEKSVENPVEKSVSEQLNSENEMPEEVIRSKKSNYPSGPYPSAPYSSASYPSAPYSSGIYPSAPYPSVSYPSSPCGCSNQYAQQSVSYNAPQISYGPPSYDGYSGSLPGYGQPQYSRPKYGKRKGNSYLKYQSSYQPQASYQSVQPSYQAPYQSPQSSYQSPQPSYQSPQPSYQSPQPSYQSPQPSYQSQEPSYEVQASYQSPQVAYQSAPVYSGSSSSYRSSAYGNQAYVAPGPSQTYSYPSSAPNVQCGSNLLVGCQPHVSQVPCSGYSPSYGNPNYARPQEYYAPGYRSADEATVSTSSTDEKTSDTAEKQNAKTSGPQDDSSVSSILSAPTNRAIEKGTNNENKNDAGQQKEATVSTTNELNPEEAKQKKIETLMKMSEMAKTLAKDEKQNPQQSQLTPTNPQNQQQNQHQNQQQNQFTPINPQNQFTPTNPQNQFTPTNPQNQFTPTNPQNQFTPTNAHSPHNPQIHDKSPLPGPPPTSVNVGMNSIPSNQVNTQFIPQQRPNPWM